VPPSLTTKPIVLDTITRIMPQLALDERQRDPLVQQLDSVRMAELVGREAPPDACLDRYLV
jgi:hypothetical protein